MVELIVQVVIVVVITDDESQMEPLSRWCPNGKVTGHQHILQTNDIKYGGYIYVANTAQSEVDGTEAGKLETDPAQ